LSEFTKLDYWICYLVALVASVIWNFTLNREYTFKSTANIPVAMFKVFIFYLIFTPTSTLLGNYLVKSLKWNEYLVTGINMICNFVLEYLYDKYIVFRGTIDTKEKNHE
jgi:putative flippase GtrA